MSDFLKAVFQESAFSAFLRFSYFIIIAIYLRPAPPLPRLWRILSPYMRHLSRSRPRRLSRASPPLRVSASPRFLCSLRSRDGKQRRKTPRRRECFPCRATCRLPSPRRRWSPHAPRIGEERHGEKRHTGEARRRSAPHQSITDFYKIPLLQFYNTRLAPRTLSHSRGENCIH